ncbi:MAG: YjbQ family protein [Isosphaeraceae bacterium]
MHSERLTIDTRGRGTHEITRQIQQAVERSGVTDGLCHVFIHHTSASLIVCENADPTVRRDLETYAARLAPDGDPSYPMFGVKKPGPAGPARKNLYFSRLFAWSEVSPTPKA